MARHNTVGKFGEGLAVEFLEKNGYRILEQNYQRKWCEIDIIAKKLGKRKIFRRSEPDELVFIEVKTRRGEQFGTPEESLDWKKKKQLTRSASAYVSFSNYRGQYRIDAVCIVLDNNWDPIRVDHYKNITGF